MDSLTQVVLGAGVAEATVGKKMGNKALLLGGIIGSIPDMDVFFSDLYSEADALLMHRGFSHSLLFCILLTPLLAFLLKKIFPRSPVTLKQWSVMTFLVLVTHPMLDMLTGYGTGFFEPFSDVRIEVNAISIIDVFYTLPFLILLIVLMFHRRTSPTRRKLIVWALSISTAYLFLTLINKTFIYNRFEQAYASQQINHQRPRTAPLPLTNFLWMGLAETDAGYYMGLYSVFDGDKPISFEYIPRNDSLIQSFEDDHAVRQIKRFSKGYYAVQKKGTDTLIFNDLRFGKMGFSENDPFVFSFRLVCNGSACEIYPTEMHGRSFSMNTYINRIFGQAIEE